MTIKAEIPDPSQQKVKSVPDNAVVVHCSCGRTHVIDGGPTTTTDRWVTARQAEAMTGISKYSVKTAIRNGRLECRRGPRNAALVRLSEVVDAVAERVEPVEEDDDLLARAIGRHQGGGA